MKITEVRSKLDRETGNHDVTVSVELTPQQGADPVLALNAVLEKLGGEGVANLQRLYPAPTEAAPAEAAPEASTGRRRRSSSDTAAPAQEAAQAPVDDGVTNRRRRTAPAPEAAPEPAPVAPVESSRRRRSSAPEAPTEIKDADLIRAASNAAAKLGGPSIILECLADYGVTQTNELKQEDRQKFLDALADEIRLADEEAAASASA